MMNKFTRGVAFATACLAVATSSIASAEVATAQFSTAKLGTVPALPAGARQGALVKDDSSLLGAPLFLLFLGAVAVTIGTIVIVNNNDGGSKSP